MRGMWRWWKQQKGGDVWFARVEVQRGEWTDIEQADYERDGLQPAFRNLPLQEDYVAEALADPLDRSHNGGFDRVENGMMQAVIIGAIILVGLMVVIMLMTDVIRFGVLS